MGSHHRPKDDHFKRKPLAIPIAIGCVGPEMMGDSVLFCLDDFPALGINLARWPGSHSAGRART